jgi:hypothetical protein
MPAVSALKNYYMESFLEAPTDILNHFWIQAAVSSLKPPHGLCNRFGSETVKNSPTEKIARSGVMVM